MDAMNTTPEHGLPGRSPAARSGDAPDWLDDVLSRLDRAAGASAGEVRSLARSLRRVFSGERLDLALVALRGRIQRRGSAVAETDLADPFVGDAAGVLDEVEMHLRAQVRAFGRGTTIENWERYTVTPPRIEL